MAVSSFEDANVPFASAAQPAKVTIQNCEDEQIRIPGSIQPHGFLLLLDDRDEYVVAASENTEDFLEVPLALILGTPVETVLEREILGALKAQANSIEAEGSQVYLGAFPMRGGFYSVVTHRLGSERVLEFERLEQLVSAELTNQVFTNFVSKLNNLRSGKELCQALTKQMKHLTGFNRVLLYRFDEFGHGTVLCEESDGILPSYLDLRFPASDIPQQARDLYVLNTVRIIPDAMYVPSPLHATGQRPIGVVDLPHRFFGACHRFTSNTCEIWGRCLSCRSPSCAKEDFGVWLAAIIRRHGWSPIWCAAHATCWPNLFALS
jgi:light-regulated signal transduction histidine kinase (bacteriophytochrome)